MLRMGRGRMRGDWCEGLSFVSLFFFFWLTFFVAYIPLLHRCIDGVRISFI
jgi:hypothetical protein